MTESPHAGDATTGQVGAWQPIGTAPKDGTQIIVTNGILRLAVRWWHGIGWSDSGRDTLLWETEPTHWMPLPRPPET